MARPTGRSGADHGGEEAAAGARWDLPPYTVLRERLLQRLDDSLTAALTVVKGPSGSGKSVLLRSWLATRPDVAARCHWVGLTAGSAAQQIRDLLAHCADGVPEGTVVVVDEMQLLPDAVLAEEMRQLVQHVLGDPGLHLVLASRTILPVSLGLLSAHGRIELVDDLDLAFREEEVRELVTLLNVPSSEDEVTRGLQFSGGWAGALRIMAEHWHRRPPHAVIALLHSYVDSEVLDHLPPEDRRLLRDASVLPVLTAVSAATVTDRRDALGRLAHLHERGVPMQWLGSDRVALNPVLRQRLQHGLRLGDERAAQVLNRRAARWLRREGDVLGAVRLLLAGGDHDLAVDVLSEEFVHLVPRYAGEVLTLLDDLPQGADWRTTLMRGAAWIYSGESVDATAVLASVEAQLAASTTVLSPAGQSALAAFRLLVWRSVGYRSSPDLTLARHPAPEQHGATDGPRHVRAVVCGLRAEYGFWLLHHGRYREAEVVLTEAVTLARLAELWWLAVECLGASSVACAMNGHNERSRHLVTEAEHLAATRDVVESVLALARIGAALTLVDDLDLEAVRALLTRHFPGGRTRAADGALVTWLESTLLVLEGRETAGLERALTFRRDTPHLTGAQQALVSMAVFRGLLELGRLDEAAREVDRLDAVAPPGQRQLVDLCRGRLLVKRGRPAEAVQLLSPYLELPGTPARDQIGLLSTLVVAAEQAEEPAVAARAHSQLDVVSDRSGVGRSGSRQSLLMARLRYRGAQLSPTELRVLRHLDSELTLSQLADDLFISGNTVKTHLRNIYRKLQVSGRQQAVEQARLLNLV
ncbi:LuxR C-terminal-related transcriptional regulator [Auraticoccus monumenti]|uniref:RNA helicase n=1 Tax=Auraticoccus monumenti TaxID=675864 RepID=A0A1G6V8M9_9ACTN|nr:LuxR C-terminal-related transcriptional regulator [Auraticoccus monumenti]SDD49753.1 RNA helicase [Auraticoccus monumenti]